MNGFPSPPSAERFLFHPALHFHIAVLLTPLTLNQGVGPRPRRTLVREGGKNQKKTPPSHTVKSAHKSANIHDGCNAKRDTSRTSAASGTEAR